MEKITRTEILDTAETVVRDYDALVDAALGQDDLNKAMDQAFKLKLSADRLCTDPRWLDTDTADNYHVYWYLAGRVALQAAIVLNALYEIKRSGRELQSVSGRELQSVLDLHNPMNVLECYIDSLREEVALADKEERAGVTMADAEAYLGLDNE
jgi:hypothetical protein